MKIGPIAAKKSVLVGIGAATVFAASSSSALASGDSMKPLPGITTGGVGPLSDLLVINTTNGCVRVYADGKQHDIPARGSERLGKEGWGRSFTASVFGKICGGYAVRTAYFKMPENSGSTVNWVIR
ncbi:hypothetical protein QFZ94_000355 [Paraburkholderia sp. JPY465]|uniref:signal peptidase n=1 Tax=Paraburkholderia sp. JPY465 TaxID=3042285 RepID=UPI003D25C19D